MISKNYQSIEDLLLDDSFWQFYFQKDADAVLDWQDWYEDNTERTDLVNKAVRLLDVLSLKWSEKQIKERIKELNFRIDASDRQDEKTTLQMSQTPTALRINPQSPFMIRKGWVAAAAVIVLIVSGLWFFSVQKSQNTEGGQEVVNTTEKPMPIRLSDNSQVILQPNSRLRFPNNFATDKREVFLMGDAFFEITKNSEKPFFVYSGEVVTQVLGTSFWIKKENPDADGKRNIVVEVVSGRVSVYKKKRNEKPDDTEGVVLTQNLKATYLLDNQLFVTGLVEKPVLLQAEKKPIADNTPSPYPFNFDDAPLSEVLTILEKAYGIQIELARESMRDCTFTADLTNNSLFEKLDLICGSLNAKYAVQGTTILVTGRGCQ